MYIVPFSVLHACKFVFLQALTLVSQKEIAQPEVLSGGQLGPDQLPYIETQYKESTKLTYTRKLLYTKWAYFLLAVLRIYS